MCAASSGSVETVKLLLDSGAEANVVNTNLQSPLMMAAEEGHTTLVELLLKTAPELVNYQDEVRLLKFHFEVC